MNIKLNNKLINLQYVNWNELESLNSSEPWWLDIISFLKLWANNYDTLDIKTSGSTGEPKTICVQKKHMVASANMTCGFFSLNSNTTGLLCLSANYIAGKMMLVRAIVSGMNLICIDPSQNPVKDITCKIDFTAMVPYQVQYAIKTPQKFNQINNLIIGGGKVSYNLVNSLKNSPVNIFETFGMTETLSHIALKPINKNTANYFTALKGIDIKQSSNGELIINAPHLGVINLTTTDIIDLIGNNTFKWKGRLDFVINTGGIKVSPEEVEDTIAHLINERYCIIGDSDKELGEKILLFVEGLSFDTNSLMVKLKETLPSYHCPKNIIFIDTFPKTVSGKIKRQVLKAMIH